MSIYPNLTSYDATVKSIKNNSDTVNTRYSGDIKETYRAAVDNILVDIEKDKLMFRKKKTHKELNSLD